MNVAWAGGSTLAAKIDRLTLEAAAKLAAPTPRRELDERLCVAPTVILHLTQGGACLIDENCYDDVSQFVWHVTTHGYVARKYMLDGKQKQEYLHRRLMKTPVKMFVDHRDLNKLNNTLHNLRNCTQAENNCNRLSWKGKKYKGIKVSESGKRWAAYIRINGAVKHIGYFSSEIDAALAYDVEAKRLHGDFANLNFPNFNRSACHDCDGHPNCICEIARADWQRIEAQR